MKKQMYPIYFLICQMSPPVLLIAEEAFQNAKEAL